LKPNPNNNNKRRYYIGKFHDPVYQSYDYIQFLINHYTNIYNQKQNSKIKTKSVVDKKRKKINSDLFNADPYLLSLDNNHKEFHNLRLKIESDYKVFLQTFKITVSSDLITMGDVSFLRENVLTSLKLYNKVNKMFLHIIKPLKRKFDNKLLLNEDDEENNDNLINSNDNLKNDDAVCIDDNKNSLNMIDDVRNNLPTMARNNNDNTHILNDDNNNHLNMMDDIVDDAFDDIDDDGMDDIVDDDKNAEIWVR
jgi:hypothetical protein